MASTSTIMQLTESFPFDSDPNSGYDEYGYPVFDRAVGALMLRNTFEKFFTNGVFPSPADSLEIGKAESGLAVTIKPGIAIINGAMGGVTGSEPMTLQLDAAPPAGNVCYGIMLHFDLRQDYRGIYFNVVRGDAAPTPIPPEPDQTTPGVFELRLGNVVVPSGNANLSNATVTNEKGTSVCPFAAPFEEIDVESIVLDFRARATEALGDFENDLDSYRGNAAAYINQLIQDLESYEGLLDSVLDDTTAGYLQQQITELKDQIGDVDLAGSVDGKTIVYGKVQGSVGNVLSVPDGGISKPKLSFGFDEPDGVASHETAVSLEKSITLVSGDLAEVLFELHVSDMGNLDLDTIAIFDFPDDVKKSQGQYDSGGNKYYAAPGTGA